MATHFDYHHSCSFLFVFPLDIHNIICLTCTQFLIRAPKHLGLISLSKTASHRWSVLLQTLGSWHPMSLLGPDPRPFLFLPQSCCSRHLKPFVSFQGLPRALVLQFFVSQRRKEFSEKQRGR